MRNDTLGRIGLVILSTGGSLLTTEVALRSTLPFDEIEVHYMRTRDVFQFDSARVRFDPELGYMTRPGLETRFANREFDTTVRTNSQGFRDDEGSLNDPDVLVLGDSFAFGWGVDQGESVADELERRTGLTVLNMGVAGYGTLQQFLLLRRFAHRHDLSGKVALFFLNAEDVRESSRHPLSAEDRYADWSGVDLRVRHLPGGAFESWLSRVRGRQCRGVYRMSVAADVVREVLHRWVDGSEALRSAPREAEQWTDFEETLGRLRAFADRNAVRVVFVYVPSRGDVERSRTSSVQPRIRQAITARSFPLINSGDVLSGTDYFRLDDHWRATGHEQVAAEVEQVLRARGMLPSIRSSSG